MRFALCIVTGLLLMPLTAQARTLLFQGPPQQAGWVVEQITDSYVEISYRLGEVYVDDVEVDGTIMQQISIVGVMLPNDQGAPNLPGTGRFIAVPQGAAAGLEILSQRTEVVTGLDIVPAPNLPFESDDMPLVFEPDPAIYGRDALYPAAPFRLSDPLRLRGVDAVVLGITPFQYNPVSRELLLYTDLRLRVSFSGGNGHFGEDRLRSRYWEPILQGQLVNYASLPPVEFNTPTTGDDQYEYVIVVPDDPLYIAWADSIKDWRTLQGIDTGVVTLTETGATYGEIEAWVDDAYRNWATPPAAVLLLADYVTSGGTTGITAPTYSHSGYTAVTDNRYADVDGDHLPDIVFARMTATPSTIAGLVTKALDYERNPVTDPGFYAEPIMACGWQTERWFTLCTEVIYGFLANEQGKTPVREYAIYQGTPGSVWSTNPNTYMVVDYFGPSGLGYIPATPGHLTDWGGSASRLNADINSGAFILQHRDHGAVSGWGEPSYSTSSLSGLSNEYLTFVFSINCLTGKFNTSGDCFAEAFHRMNHGALGLIAATETSMSFVNDVFVFGIYDCMWPEFDPGYPDVAATGPANLRPGFANASAKYYLQASSWPYNPEDKPWTCYLFHMHGDAFTTLYSEVPQPLTVSHDGALQVGAASFNVHANPGAMIALTLNGEILGVAEATGTPQSVAILPPTEPGMMKLTITKANYYRYQEDVPVIAPDGPFVVLDHHDVLDDGDGDGDVDAGESIELVSYLKNVGSFTATDVTGTLSTEGPAVITDDSERWGDIAPEEVRRCDDSFDFDVPAATPDQTVLSFTLTAVCAETTFVRDFDFTVEAPLLELVGYTVLDEEGGDGDGMAEPGETVALVFHFFNSGHEHARQVTGTLSAAGPYIQIEESTAFAALMGMGLTSHLYGYRLTVHPDCPQMTTVDLGLELTASLGYETTFTVPFPVAPFLDDCEVDRSWTVAGTATTGMWERADPEGTTSDGQPCQPEDDHTPDPAHICMVTGALAGSSVGSYDVDGGNTVLTSPVFDLAGAVEATFEYWRWYTNDLGSSPGEDWWSVEVSNDAGASWHYLEHTQASANFWQKMSFDLAGTIALTDRVRFRFTAEDAGSGSLVEAAVDDLMLTARYIVTDIAEEDLPQSSPAGFALRPNRPNPFNPCTEIEYRLEDAATPRTTLKVFDSQGRLVRILVDADQPAGHYRVFWDGTQEDGRTVASGVYFYVLTSGDRQQARRMVLIK